MKYQNTKVSELLKSLFGAFVLTLGAQITVPFVPVPLTLQTMAIFFVALSGAKQGTLAVLFYLLEGAIGLPVFAGFSSGVHVILGATGGYLLGFVPAAYLSGVLFQKSLDKNFWTIFFAGLVGVLAVFVCGYLHLAYFVGFSRAYTAGVAPFYLTELMKLLIFSLLVCTGRDLI
jgi:biotin transport system substrate-specific component